MHIFFKNCCICCISHISWHLNALLCIQDCILHFLHSVGNCISSAYAFSAFVRWATAFLLHFCILWATAFEITCPEDAGAGDVMTIVDGDGDKLELEIPEGVVPGETFSYRIE